MAIDVYPGNRFEYLGDSTASPTPLASLFGGYLKAAIEATFVPTPVVRAGTATGSAGTVTGSAGGCVAVTPPSTITEFFRGQAGALIVDVPTSDVPIDQPDIVFMFAGTNNIVPATPLATFQAQYEAKLDTILAWNPSTKIICMSIPFRLERWAPGPVRWNYPPISVDVANYNARIQAAALSRGATYIDVSAPFLVLESINNPIPLDSGVYGDPIHLITAGQVAIAPMIMPFLTVHPN